MTSADTTKRRWALAALSPAEPLDERQRLILMLVGLASMATAFLNTVFTQTVAFAAEEFDVSTTAQGAGAAVVRAGIVICLPLVALADRRGRRPLIVALAWISPLVTALGAVAPNFPFLVATQVIGRPLGLTLDILVAVLAIEEMPRNSRAWATGMLAVLSGVGAGVAVAALPLADLGASWWRAVYLLALLWLFVALALTRRLPESRRFTGPAIDAPATARRLPRLPRLPRGFGPHLGRICTVVFLTNVYVATASIFQNRYLRDERGYSALMIALFTVATSAPAGLGLVAGGRVADARGRRVLGATMVPLGAMLLAVSFAVSGPPMWAAAIAGSLAFGIAYPAMSVYRGELFPTRVRSTAGGIIMTSSLLGGIVGLVGGGAALDTTLSYGAVMAALVTGPLVAALIVWFRYPETARLSLEEITGDGPDRDATPTP